MEWEDLDLDLSNEEKIHETADLSKLWKNHIGNRRKKVNELWVWKVNQRG